MDLYEYISVFVIPLSIFNFSLEYLSDSEIGPGSEYIGVINAIHHFFYALNTAGVLCLPFLAPGITVITVSIVAFIIMLIGYQINKDSCFITRYYNTKINPKKPNRKWRAGIESGIKHYLRGNEWAYADMPQPDYSTMLIMMNLSQLINLLKYSFKV